MSPEAEAIMNNIVDAYHGILDLGLEVNHAELVNTVHHLQMFVMIYELKDRPGWNDWYAENPIP